jgi:hypothetical protein
MTVGRVEDATQLHLAADRISVGGAFDEKTAMLLIVNQLRTAEESSELHSCLSEVPLGISQPLEQGGIGADRRVSVLGLRSAVFVRPHPLVVVKDDLLRHQHISNPLIGWVHAEGDAEHQHPIRS